MADIYNQVLRNHIQATVEQGCVAHEHVTFASPADAQLMQQAAGIDIRTSAEILPVPASAAEAVKLTGYKGSPASVAELEKVYKSTLDEGRIPVRITADPFKWGEPHPTNAFVDRYQKLRAAGPISGAEIA